MDKFTYSDLLEVEVSCRTGELRENAAYATYQMKHLDSPSIESSDAVLDHDPRRVIP
jgi:hypothetical protein